MINLNKLTQILSILLILFFTQSIRAQVTIGSGLPPIQGALLDLKQKESSGESAAALTNSTKGITLPRVALEASNSLRPLYENATAEEKLLATGMVVYNITDDLRVGLLYWDGEKWLSPFGPVDIVKIAPVDCSTISVSGAYVVGKPLDPLSNYITMDITVLKPGAYELIVSTPSGTEDNNGFYFKASGNFTEAKTYTGIVLQGSGTPNIATTNSSLSLKLNGIDQALNCTNVGISVVDPLTSPQYTIDCNSVTVYGTFYKDQNLSAEYNSISFYINSDNDPDIYAVQYSIKAESEDGTIRFAEKTGTLNKGLQRITLEADPTSLPTSAGNKTIVITTNSEKDGTTECSTEVTVIPSSINMYFQGSERYIPGSYDVASKKMLTSSANFGPSEASVVKTPTPTIAYQISGSDDVFTTNLNNKPDIAMITWGYDYGDNTAVRTALANYINSGGVLIVTMENEAALPRLLNRLNTILGTDLSSGGYAGSDGDAPVFQLSDIDHPILNGPFGDIRGKYFGYDNGYSNRLYTGTTDTSKFKSLSGNTNYATTPQVFANSVPLFLYEDEINGVGRSIIIFSDGGTLASWSNAEVKASNCYTSRFGEFGYDMSRYKNTSGCSGGDDNWYQYYPTATDGSGTPIPTYRFGKVNRYTIQNGILWANIFAWAINRAMTNGINSGN